VILPSHPANFYTKSNTLLRSLHYHSLYRFNSR